MMPFLNLKVLCVSLGIVVSQNSSKLLSLFSEENFSTSMGVGNSNDAINPEIANLTGYRAVMWHNNGFIAVGSQGRIDRFSASGMLVSSEKFEGEDFTCILADNKGIIVAGANGTIMVSTEKEPLKKAKSGTDKDINSLIRFNEKIIAGTSDGLVLMDSKNGSFQNSNLALKGIVVSLSARKNECFGVTNEGEIIHSVDGTNWDILDFNTVYSGYYKSCRFTKVLATEKSIAVAGKYDDGSPALFFSSMGNVWTERSLVYSDYDGFQKYLDESPNDIFYSVNHDQFLLACNKGKVITIPSCSHCNKLIQLPMQMLTGISGNGETLMVVGSDFFSKAINPDWE